MLLRKKQQAVHTAGGQRWEFYFSPIKYAIPIPIRTVPILIPISSPKLLPFPWKSYGNGNSHSRCVKKVLYHHATGGQISYFVHLAMPLLVFVCAYWKTLISNMHRQPIVSI